MQVELKYHGTEGSSHLAIEIDENAPNFLDAVASKVAENGLDVARIALWLQFAPTSSLAAVLWLKGDDQAPLGPVFIPRDVSSAEIADLAAAVNAGQVIVHANEGVGGDDIWSFIVSTHDSVQHIFEFAAYFQIVRYVWLRPRRKASAKPRAEFRIAVVVGQVSPELRALLRAKETWTSSDLEERFGLSFESVRDIMLRCGFSPRADRIAGDVVWYRDLNRGDAA